MSQMVSSAETRNWVLYRGRYVWVGLIRQITIFDNRGCTQHVNKEFKGPKANGPDDEMVVKVSNEKIPYPTDDVVVTCGQILTMAASSVARRRLIPVHNSKHISLIPRTLSMIGCLSKSNKAMKTCTPKNHHDQPSRGVWGRGSHLCAARSL